jgi:C1A family cysteine protease
VSGALAGGHCVTLIGYDDAQGCWIGKNSWGTGWGEAGFFKIAYGECGIETWLGPWAASGVSARLWRNNLQVRGLWTNESDRNAWVYLNGVGWRKIAANDDQITLSMLAELIAAKAAARPVNVFDDGGTINQLYVL